MAIVSENQLKLKLGKFEFFFFMRVSLKTNHVRVIYGLHFVRIKGMNHSIEGRIEVIQKYHNFQWAALEDNRWKVWQITEHDRHIVKCFWSHRLLGTQLLHSRSAKIPNQFHAKTVLYV